jgi:hypothetical protein
MTVGKDNPMKVYYHTRNRILYMRRNSDAFHLLIFSLFFTFFSFPKAVIVFLLKGQMAQLKWFLKGVGYNFTHNSKSTC